MKLATVKAGGRDGTLVVVSRDLARAVAVPNIARTLQAALDDWAVCATKLRAVYRNQRLYRALTAVDGVTLLVTTPSYAAGDEMCCPSQMLQRSLTWSPQAKRLVLRSRRTVAPAP